MLAIIVAEVSSRSIGGHSAFSKPRDSWGVVTARGNGGVLDREGVCDESSLREDACMLQIAVGDDALGVIEGHQQILDSLWEGVSPNVALARGVVEDSSHARLGGIGGTDIRRLLRDDFSQMSRAMGETGSQGGKGVNVLPQGLSDADAISLGSI